MSSFFRVIFLFFFFFYFGKIDIFSVYGELLGWILMIFWTLEDDVESYLFPLFCDFVVFFLLVLV